MEGSSASIPYFLGLLRKTGKNKVLTLEFVFLLIFPNSSWIHESVQHPQHLGASLNWTSHGLLMCYDPITVQEEAASNHSLRTLHSLSVSKKPLHRPQILQQTRIYSEFGALLHFSGCVLSIRQMVKGKSLQGATKATFFDMPVKEKTLDSSTSNMEKTSVGTRQWQLVWYHKNPDPASKSK